MPTNRLAVAGLAAVVVVAVAFGGWYLLFRDHAPPPVNLDDAIASIATSTAAPTSTTPSSTATATATATAAATAATAPATVDPSVTSASADGDLSGTWVVASVGDSFAGYRVGEELSSVGIQTAVGRTGDLNGMLEFDGSTITAVDIEVNVASLTSDDSRRDRQLRERGLQTDRFPTATFTLTTPIEVNPLPSEGEPFAADAAGDLTLHGVTQAVVIELNGQLVDGLVVVVGSIQFQFADFGIVPPTGFIVLSVDDHGILEFQLVFEPAR